MKLSTKCRYGTRAMIEIARVYGGAPAKRKDVAAAQGLSRTYLENILITLKHAGLIRAARGARGGFTLARPPEAVTLLDIVSALEGTLAPVDCLEKPASCGRSDSCAARQAWRKLHQAQTQALAAMTLRDLLAMEAAGPAATYDI